MPIVGTYSFGSASATEWDSVDDLLSQIPDNTANLIVAKDIRDSVYTLWERVEDVNLIASSAASASSYFQNPDATPVTVGGIAAGSTFPTPKTMQEMWDLLLYPYVGPGASLTISGNTTREYGNPSGLSTNSISLNWTATKNTDPITTIIVDSQAQVPTGNTQVGVKTTTGTHSTSPASSQTNTFNMSVGDGTSTDNDSAVLTWMNRRYWGYIDLSSIGNPNLTTNPGSASLVATLCTDTAIKALSGAGVGSGNELSSSKSKTYTGIDGGGSHLIFAWPSNVSGALSPAFTVNGLPNTAFTRVRTLDNFVNQYGFTDEYEVWVSNTVQNSPLNIVIS